MKKLFLISGYLAIALQLFAQKVYDNDIVFKNGNSMQLKSTIGIESTVNSTKIDEKENNIEIKMQDATIVQIAPNETTINPTVIAPTIQADTGNIANITANNITTSNINVQTVNINPKNGLDGYYIGEKTLGQIVDERIAEALNNLDAEDVINPTGVITAEFNKIYVFTRPDNGPDTLEIIFKSLKSRPNLVVIKGYTNVNFSFMENRNKKIKINIRETFGIRNDDNEPQVFEVFKAGGTPFVFKK